MARTLPNGKPISALGFGCSSLWSKPTFPAEQAQAMLDAAVANGITHFDTSPSYADGEARLGAFLKGRDVATLTISTKVGTEHGDQRRSFAPDRMRASFEGSLARLGLDRVDILYLHGPETADLTPPVFAFLDRLKATGRVAYTGINSFDPAVVAAAVDAPIDVVMLQYGIGERRFDALIDRLVARSKIVIAGTILARSIFDLRTFLPRDAKRLWYLARALRHDPLFPIEGWRLGRRIARTGLSPHEAAIRFATAHPGVTSSLFGTSSLHHLIDNARTGLLPPLDEHERRILSGQRPTRASTAALAGDAG